MVIGNVKVTDRQAEVLGYIVRCINSRGYSPTFREIGAEFGIRSPNAVRCHLKALEAKGLIVRDHKLSRAITPTLSFPAPVRKPIGIPYLGEIS